MSYGENRGVGEMDNPCNRIIWAYYYYIKWHIRKKYVPKRDIYTILI